MDGWDLVDPKIKRIVDVLSFNKDKLYHLKQLAVDARVSHATTFRIIKTVQNKMKKGQITLFAVAGLMVLLLFFFIVVVKVYFATEEAKEQIIQTEEIPSQIQNVENFVRRCIRSFTIYSLVILGRQAGYITVPELIRKDTTAYWHLDKANIQPTLNQIKIELEKQVD